MEGYPVNRLSCFYFILRNIRFTLAFVRFFSVILSLPLFSEEKLNNEKAKHNLLPCHLPLPACRLVHAFHRPRWQVVRGMVIDEQTLMPIPGAAKVIIDSSPFKSTSVDADDKFRFNAIHFGRVGLKINMIGYFETSMLNIPFDAPGKWTLRSRLRNRLTHPLRFYLYYH